MLFRSDGVVNGLAAAVGGLSSRVRKTQTGYARNYAAYMLGGAVLIAFILYLVRL